MEKNKSSKELPLNNPSHLVVCKTSEIKPLRVSKYLRIQVLLDLKEMQELFDTLGPFFLFIGSEPVNLEAAEIAKEVFLKHYSTYLESLTQNTYEEKKEWKSAFSSMMSCDKQLFYAQSLANGKMLIKSSKPVIQLQQHHFFISSLDGSIHPMVLSKDSIRWGLQFSYPQLFQNPENHQIEKVLRSKSFPNSELFSTLLQWMRDHTIPTPFAYQGKKINSPIRLGKKCLPWIAQHTQLKEKSIIIASKG